MTISAVQLATAMELSFALIVVIIACANFIQWYGRKRTEKRAASQSLCREDFIVPPKHFILLRVLLDKNGHASLSTFQLLMWTLLISFLYITLWFLQLREGSTQAPPAIPEGLMALMGISVGVPIVSKGISEYKKLKTRSEGEVYSEPRYASMLEEDGQPSLLRFQMFLWTLAAVVIYFWLFTTTVFNAGPETVSVALPDIDPTLLFLMGLSQAGYLGSAAYAGTLEKSSAGAVTPPERTTATESVLAAPSPAIRETIPRSAGPHELVTLLGSGFGSKPDSLMIGQEKVSSENIRRWEDTRIEFTLPDTGPPGKHTLVVMTEGKSGSGEITVSTPAWVHEGIDKTPADIISEIWIDDPSQKSYRIPPIGYFIPGKRYYFFFEYAVPPGTPSWGRTEFQAGFYIDGKPACEPRSFMPGYMNGKNYGVFDYRFESEGTFTIEIRGATAKSMDVVVKRPPGVTGG